MKFLKISDSRGFYLKDKSKQEDWTEIDQIDKNDLMRLTDYAIEADFEMDLYDESLIQHKAHQIIYKNLFEKFTALLSSKNRFKDESESIYKIALEKYK
jgi:hypothetical protein